MSTVPSDRRSRAMRLWLAVALGGCLGVAGLAWAWRSDPEPLLAESAAKLRAALDEPLSAEFGNRVADAEALAERYLQRDGPSAATAKCLQAAALLLQRRYDEAQRLVARCDPRQASTPGLLALAESLCLIHDFATAQGLVEQARRRRDAGTAALRLAVIVAGEMGRDDEALRLAREWSERDPDSAEAWRLSALIRVNQSEPDLAIQAFRETRQRGGRLSREERMELVRQLIAVGNAADARAEWTLLADQLASLHAGQRLLVESKLLHLEGETALALDAARRAVQAAPNDAETLAQLGRVLLALSQPAEAEAPLQKAVSRAPSNLEALYLLAQAELLQGREGNAAKHLEHYRRQRTIGVEVNRLQREAAARPYDAEVRTKIAALYRESGLTDQARFWSNAAEAVRRAGNSP